MTKIGLSDGKLSGEISIYRGLYSFTALMAGQSDNSHSKTDSFTPQEVCVPNVHTMALLSPFKLRDLFTIQLQTACHTHDLLGCICNNGSTQVDDGLDESNADFESRPRRDWIPASQIKPDQLEQKVVTTSPTIQINAHSTCLPPSY